MEDKTNEHYFSFWSQQHTTDKNQRRLNNLKKTPAAATRTRSSSIKTGDNKILMWTAWTTWFLILNWNLTLTSSFCPPLCSCNDVTLSVDCHEAGNLRLVPIFFNPQTRFLSLAQNQITEIAMSFQFYSELTFLDFSENKIETIGQNNFENLKALRVLNASYNTISVLEEDVFLGLPNLQVLDLSVNQIEKVGKKVLSASHASNTKKDDDDAEYEEKLWTLKSLRELDLSWNQLTRVKNYGLSVFSSLNSINLCCNYIHTIEEKAFVPYNVESWSSSSSSSSSSLSDSSSSPASPSHNHHLMFVNLSQNRLGRIPTDALDKLGSLIELDLSSNGISDQIGSHSFHGLGKLQKLRLNDNPGITSFDPDAFIDNMNLIEFEGNHLSNLTQFEAGLFNNKPYLVKFSLQFTQISTIPVELFENPQYTSLVSTLSLLGSPLDCNCSSYPLFSWITTHQGASSSSSSSTAAVMRNTKSNNHRHNNGLVDSSSSSANKDEQLLHPISQQLKSMTNQQPFTLAEQLVCANPPNLVGVHLKDLNTAIDYEGCFDQFPLLFTNENFEILVLLLASIIIAIILVVVVVKFCCVYKMCAKCTLKLKNRRRDSCGNGNGLNGGVVIRQSSNRKDIMINNCNGLLNGGVGGGCGVMSVDEFCSNFTTNNKSILHHEFPAVAVSPELVTKIKNTIHLTGGGGGGINDPVNGKMTTSSQVGAGGGGGALLVENNGLLQQLSTMNSTTTVKCAGVVGAGTGAGTMGRYSNGLLCHNNNSNNLLRNNPGGHSLSTMTTGLTSSTTPDEEDYRQQQEQEEDDYEYDDEEEEEEDVDDDVDDDDDGQLQLQDSYYRQRQPPPPPPPLPHREHEPNNYFMTTNGSGSTSSSGLGLTTNAGNNKLRFDPDYNHHHHHHMKDDMRSAFNHPLHSYHHSSRLHHRHQYQQQHQVPPALPTVPPPMLLHYEYDYPEYPNNNKHYNTHTHSHTPATAATASGSHHRSSHNNHTAQRGGSGSTNGSGGGGGTPSRIKQVPSVLV